MKNKIALSVRFPQDLYERLKDVAEQNWRSLNAEILAAIEDHIRRNTNKKEE